MSLLSAHQMKMTVSDCQSKAASPQEETSGVGEQESLVKSSGRFTFRDEFLRRMYKFSGVINTTLQNLQIQGQLILGLCFFGCGTCVLTLYPAFSYNVQTQRNPYLFPPS